MMRKCKAVLKKTFFLGSVTKLHIIVKIIAYLYLIKYYSVMLCSETCFAVLYRSACV
jgi:hypothetical protein